MSRARNSQSDDERTLQASDEDILQEEEDRERLLATPTSSVKRLLKRDEDPNKPRAITRKEMRRQWRRERKAKRRKADEGDGLMFEMEDGKSLDGDHSDEDADSESSTEQFAYRPQTKWVR